jgi:universal stress protein A
MSWSKILLSTDFSTHSYEGLRMAEMLAHQSNAELLIVHVLDSSESHEQNDWPDTEAANRDLERWLLEPTPPSSNLTVSHALLEGNPAEEIVRCARQRQVDLIVMGSHGRTGIPRALMGSVTTQVLHHAPCDVLTVRPRVPLRGDIKAWAHRKHKLRPSPSI